VLTRLGMKVNYAAVDWVRVVARRAQKSPVSGSWNVYLTSHPGVDCASPATGKAVSRNPLPALVLLRPRARAPHLPPSRAAGA